MSAATVASRTNQLNLTAGSLSHSDNADVDTYLDWSFGVTGLSRLFGSGGGTGTQTGSSLIGGINGSYTSRNVQGATFTRIGEGRVVIGGQENPLAQGTINRDINGRQIVTVNEGTKFSFDIPLVDFNQLSQNATSAFNLMQALTTPVPDDVAAMGDTARDYYQRMISSGLSPDVAASAAATPEFAALINEVEQAKLRASAGEAITPDVEAAIAVGFAKLVATQDGTIKAVIVGCQPTSGPGDCQIELDKLKGHLEKNPQLASLFEAQAAGALKDYLKENPNLDSAGFVQQGYAARLYRDLLTCSINSGDPGSLAAFRAAYPEAFDRLNRRNALLDPDLVNASLDRFERNGDAATFSAELEAARTARNQSLALGLAKFGFDLTTAGAVYGMAVAARNGEIVGVVIEGLGLVPLGKIAGMLGKSVGEVKALLTGGGRASEEIAEVLVRKGAAGELLEDGTKIVLGRTESGALGDAFKALEGKDIAKLTSKEVGDLAEDIVMKQLQSSGKYSEVVALKNPSGHGVDLIAAKASDGSFVFYEVKGSKYGYGSGLSADQKDMADFVKTRVDRAADGGGQWQGATQEVKDFANRVSKWLGDGNTPTGEVVRVNLSKTDIRSKPW